MADPRDSFFIGEAINQACDSLPDGWEVRIELFRNSATVSLFDDAGDEVDFEQGVSFSQKIKCATETATGAGRTALQEKK